MNSTGKALQEIFDRIPRRHSVENMSEMNALLMEYEDLLITIEAENSFYEQQIPVFFEDLELVAATIKNANSPRFSKKVKDNMFDDGSGKLKDSIEALMAVYAGGGKTK